MRPLTFVALLILGSTSLGAQVIRLPQRSSEPIGWMSAYAGLHQPNPVPDGGTGTTWDFGTGLLYRLSIEQAMQGGSSFGLTGTYAHMPLTHRGDPACSGDCDAHGDIWQLLASFTLAGGEGFHQVIEFSAGVTHYRNFTVDATGEALAPLDGDNDFTLGVGYGFGFGFSRRTHIVLIQDFVTTFHQRHGLAGGDNNFVQQRTLRLGLRYGLGNRERN